MGLFNKKICDICGGEIGLLGNRKLSDGNLCKECAQKLSPWMTDRRQSTVEEIRQHLAYREQNKALLGSVHPTLVMGGGSVKVYIDENAGCFFVTSHSNWRDRNPDIIPFRQVIDVNTEVTEHRTEEYHRDREGKEVPFNPPRYRYSYEFNTTILVDSPYFSEISFELTGQARPERVGSDEYRYYEQMADALRAALKPVTPPAQEKPAAQPNLGQVLSAALGQVIAPSVAAAKSAAKPAQEQWTCACGALNAGNFCTQCGAKRPEKPKLFRCDKCGWTPEDPTHPPKFCPNCGDPFTQGDAL